jgi:hypothetical protein
MVFVGGPVAADVLAATTVATNAVASAAVSAAQDRCAQLRFVSSMSNASFRRDEMVPALPVLPGRDRGMRISCKNQDKGS